LFAGNQDNVSEWCNLSTSGMLFAGNQDNVSEWSNMSTSGMLLTGNQNNVSNNIPLVDMLPHSDTLS
jgi:hypothetical protein